ncbi:MAG: SH3 domain-containing protein [Lachnospiraceae bacterium]|nr:SH3 domain-containing protein [Lachnospiraceae bacterium]
MKSKKNWGFKASFGALSLILVLTIALFADGFGMVSLAAKTGKITANSVNVRKEASATSEVVTGAEKDKVVTVNGEVTGTDGKVWYKVDVDGMAGYIRSDLMSVTDSNAGNQNTNTNTNTQVTAQVVKVVPVSGKVTGGQAVRVRADATTSSSIVTTLQSGTALTITGMATASDGMIWYQVSFTKDGAEKEGFIRQDYVNPSANVVPESAVEPEEPDEPVEQEPEEPDEPVVQETKRWETSKQDDTWYLIDNENAKRYEINDMLNAAVTNAELYYDSQDTVKAQKIAIILLVILLMGAIGGAVYLFYRFKDATDAAYISAVEKETIVRRSTAPMPRPAAQPGQRPTGQPGQRPTGQPGQRPTGQPGQRPAGQPPQRPTGQPGQRPTQPPQRPAGQPAQAPVARQTAGNAEQKPAQSVSQPYHQPVPPQKPIVDRAAAQPTANEGSAQEGWRAKNFMSDEDEFEFDFLNWDGAEEE